MKFPACISQTDMT